MGKLKMKIYIDKLYKDDRKNELCGVCVPFKKGALPAEKLQTVKVLDGERAVPVQTESTSVWEDGSIRFAYVHFLSDLPGNKKKELTLTFEGDDEGSFSKADMQTGSDLGEILFEETDGRIRVDNGPLKLTVCNDTDRLFESFEYCGKSFERDQFFGPSVKINRQRLESRFDSWKIVKKGPILLVLEGKGRSLIAGERSFSGEGIKFEMRLSIALGKPWIDVGYRFINCTEGDLRPDDIIFYVSTDSGAEPSLDSPLVKDTVQDPTGCGDTRKGSNEGDYVTFMGTKDLPTYDITKESMDGGDFVRTAVGSSNYRTEFKISKTGCALENTITAELLKKQANEHFADVFYGTFFGDVTDTKKGIGVCATVFQAFQNFPKAVRAEKDGLTVFLLPDQDINRERTASSPVVFASGMAREQRFLLHFHDASEPLYELDNRSIIYQMPDSPHIDPVEFEKAGVFPKVFLPLEKQDEDVETLLIEKADSHVRSYGMLCFGDGPDPGYTAQGRGGGDLVWTNNEYDYPHAMYMMYARSGVRRFLDYATVAARHWMDVDVCHYSSDPLRQGGQWEHSKHHTGGSVDGIGNAGEMVCSHEWVEGLLDLYHFTSDERALKTALGIGENVLRLLDTPMYQVPGEASARETGWALRSLTALFLETHDRKWVEKCEWIVGQFKAWNDRYGAWLSPYTDNTAVRVGFMISVALGSLMRYYRAFPSEELKKMMLDAVDDLTENFMTDQGIFMYKELPSLSRNGTNTLLLEAMSIGYELSGDEKYLDFGRKTFMRAIEPVRGSYGGKRIVEDTVLEGSGGPKGFAQSFYPITAFYVNLMGANKLLTR